MKTVYFYIVIITCSAMSAKYDSVIYYIVVKIYDALYTYTVFAETERAFVNYVFTSVLYSWPNTNVICTQSSRVCPDRRCIFIRLNVKTEVRRFAYL